MQYRILLWGILFLMSTQVWGQNGLVAYYPFNSSANDESINGNHLQVHGALLTSDRFGRADSAYAFDGVDDFMRIPFNPSLKPGSIGVAAWIKITEQPQHGKYILTTSGDMLTPPYDPFRLRLKISRKIAVRFEGNEDKVHMDLESSAVLDLERWYYIATYYDEETGEGVLYVDGKLEDRQVALMMLDSNELDAIIGAGQLFDGTLDSTAYFAGDIDDIRIFNRVLTKKEIDAFFLEGTGRTNKLSILEQNYPNPFNQVTIIRYALSSPSRVRVSVFNIVGQEVRRLVDEAQPRGNHTARWDGRDAHGREVSSGLYLYRVTADSQRESRKMLLIK